MVEECDIEVRVRYCEADPMGYLHHSQYLVFMEMARTELLRLNGLRYRDCEEQGFFFVVVKAQIRYKGPARYDDTLRVHVKINRITRAKIEHEYQVYRDGRIIAEANTVLGCVGRDGRVQEIPESLRGKNGQGEPRANGEDGAAVAGGQ
jgi:acyl-CoA thioester hydrolase